MNNTRWDIIHMITDKYFVVFISDHLWLTLRHRWPDFSVNHKDEQHIKVVLCIYVIYQITIIIIIFPFLWRGMLWGKTVVCGYVHAFSKYMNCLLFFPCWLGKRSAPCSCDVESFPRDLAAYLNIVIQKTLKKLFVIISPYILNKTLKLMFITFLSVSWETATFFDGGTCMFFIVFSHKSCQFECQRWIQIVEGNFKRFTHYSFIF